MLDLATVSSQSIYDLSTPIYGFMSMIIYYLTLSYVPNELIENTLSLIIKDMNSGIVCFDIHGRCIYCNDILRNFMVSVMTMKRWKRNIGSGYSL